MRYLVFSLVSIAFLLFGCRDNKVTDPVSPNQINKISDFSGNTARGSIPLDKVLYVSGSDKDYYQINGKINYSEEFIRNNSGQAETGSAIKLGVFVDAVLTDPRVVGFGYNGWKISSESEDVSYINREGINVIERSYPVMNRKDDMQLVCTFILTNEGLSLDNMVLKIPNNQRAG